MSNSQVLVVEDDESIREGIREILEMEGLSVSTASHGLEAYNLLTSGAIYPNVILLDLNMPVMSGKEFFEKLQSERESLRQIPVIVMTAFPNPDIQGMSGLLKKPVDLEDILTKVKAFC